MIGQAKTAGCEKILFKPGLGECVTLRNKANSRTAAIPAWNAGQIGRTADLHGFAARRVRDMDVSHASSPQGGEVVGLESTKSNTC